VAKQQGVRLTRTGPRELRQLPSVRADLERRAARINRAAGGGMNVDSTIGKTRARATVAAVSREARRAEATGRALTRAIDAGRG
jgi:hypothetical protein